LMMSRVICGINDFLGESFSLGVEGKCPETRQPVTGEGGSVCCLSKSRINTDHSKVVISKKNPKHPLGTLRMMQTFVTDFERLIREIPGMRAKNNT
jgi:hypothetical protein